VSLGFHLLILGDLLLLERGNACFALLQSHKLLKSILDWLVFNDANFCSSHVFVSLEAFKEVEFICNLVSLAIGVLEPEIEPVFALKPRVNPSRNIGEVLKFVFLEHVPDQFFK
jgi:hypothetical protein